MRSQDLLRTVWSLWALGAAGILALPARARPQGDIALVSQSTFGIQGNMASYSPVISGDGNWIAFTSYATNLTLGDANAQEDVFVRDLRNARTILVSQAPNGEQCDAWSGAPSISADGRLVAFASKASNLVPPDANEVLDVFVRDCEAATTTLVSRSIQGGPGDSWSRSPSVAGDRFVVAFVSAATNLVEKDENGVCDVFVRDLRVPATSLLSLSTDGVQGNAESKRVSISADGNLAAFESAATNLVAGDTNDRVDVFVRDRKHGVTRLVSHSPKGEPGNGTSDFPALSGDGRYLAFVSNASNLVEGDTNGMVDVFVTQLRLDRPTLVSQSSKKDPGNANSYCASISRDGRYVVFVSTATTLIDRDMDAASDVFLRDCRAGTTTLLDPVSKTSSGGPEEGTPTISGNGRRVAFISFLPNLAGKDANGPYEDVFVREIR